MAVGYGRDTWCTDRIRTGHLVSGIELLGQALYRRLITPQGTLRDGDDGLTYGKDLAGFVGTIGTQDAADALPDVIQTELLKDDRVERVEASATLSDVDSSGLKRIDVEILITPVDEETDFRLTLSVTDATVALLGIEPVT